MSYPRRLPFLLTAILAALYSPAPIQAQDMFDPNYGKTVLNGARAGTQEYDLQKDIEDCQNFLSEINHKYSDNIYALLADGKLEQAVAQQRKALELLKQVKYESKLSKLSIKQAITQSYVYIAGLYRNSNKSEQAGQALMEGFRDPAGEKYFSYAMQAGGDFLSAEKPELAAESFKAALSVADESKEIWAIQGMWKALLKEGRSNQVIEELKNSESKIKTMDKPTVARSYRVAMKEIYEQIGLKTYAANLQEQLDNKHCPVCHSDATVKMIQYGLVVGAPPDTPLGGCCIEPDSPHWWCSKDKVAF